ncbi:MAG: hypothetical protein ABSE64_13045 [Vulcanimicrobiaceae bacterium]
MRPLVGILILGLIGATPAPYSSSIKALNARMHVMLHDVAHRNEQTEVTLTPDASGLRTIVRVRVHPYMRAQLRNDLTKSVNEYIDIHQGDCRTNTSRYGTNAYALNPINNGVSETTLDVPISTLTGNGNVVTTHYGNGAVINCGRL